MFMLNAIMKAKIINYIIDTNLKGLIGLTKQVLPQMYKRRSGIIVNMSSALGKIAKPGVAAYCSSKFGVIGFSEALAIEVMQRGIKVYVLCPGGVDTQIHRNLDGLVEFGVAKFLDQLDRLADRVGVLPIDAFVGLG